MTQKNTRAFLPIAFVMMAVLVLAGCTSAGVSDNSEATSSTSTQGQDQMAMMEDEGHSDDAMMMEEETDDRMMMEDKDHNDDSMMMEEKADDRMAMESASDEAEVEVEAVPEAQVAALYQEGAVNQYSREAFEQAVADGKDIAVDFKASWCTVCKANEKPFKEAVSDAGVVAFQADYDTEDELKKEFLVNMQSTVVFLAADGTDSSEEKARVSGPQTEESFKELFNN